MYQTIQRKIDWWKRRRRRAREPCAVMKQALRSTIHKDMSIKTAYDDFHDASAYVICLREGEMLGIVVEQKSTGENRWVVESILPNALDAVVQKVRIGDEMLFYRRFDLNAALYVRNTSVSSGSSNFFATALA